MHILGTAIHFLWGWGWGVEHNASHAHIHASLFGLENIFKKKEKDLMTLRDVCKIMKSVKLNQGCGAWNQNLT